MAKNTILIRDFYNRIIGRVETQPSGDKIGRDFYGTILGYYKKQRDVTTDFYGIVLTKGDTLASLIMSEYQKEQAKKFKK